MLRARPAGLRELQERRAQPELRVRSERPVQAARAALLELQVLLEPLVLQEQRGHQRRVQPEVQALREPVVVPGVRQAWKRSQGLPH